MSETAANLVVIEHVGRVATITLNRPEALNSFNEALYDAATDALIELGANRTTAVVIVTGTGRAFSSGADLVEMAGRISGNFVAGRHGFPGFIDVLAAFPKPLICAVNGLAVGIGATMLGFAELVVMSSEARLRFPFTSLGVVPEAASSFIFPRLVGHQNAAWMLMSSEWISAAEALRMGVAFRVCEPDDVMPTALTLASAFASKPISSLMASKATIVASRHAPIHEARERENAGFVQLMGKPANIEALAAFSERRHPDFARLDD